MRIMEPLPTEFTQVFFRASVPFGGWPKRFAVVTAHNPDGQLVEPAANDAADAELRTAIEKRGLTYFRVTGGSRDEKHREPGWGFSSTTPQSAQELSQRFRQDAQWESCTTVLNALSIEDLLSRGWA